MKMMYLNLYKWILSQVFLMGFGNKFKISIYHEDFSEVLEKCTCFPKFTVLASDSYERINGEAIWG